MVSVGFRQLCSLAGRYDNPIPTRFLAPYTVQKFQHRYTIQFHGGIMLEEAHNI
jgi:hypothetical protein